MAEDGFSLRAGTAEDYDEIYRILSLAFNDDQDDAEREDERLVYEPGRAIVVLDGDARVGVAGAYTRDLAIPGGTAAAAAANLVSVEPVYPRPRILPPNMLQPPPGLPA